MKVKTHLKAGQTEVNQSNNSTVNVTQSNSSSITLPPPPV
jgi:hypothetical protein